MTGDAVPYYTMLHSFCIGTYTEVTVMLLWPWSTQRSSWADNSGATSTEQVCTSVKVPV